MVDCCCSAVRLGIPNLLVCNLTWIFLGTWWGPARYVPIKPDTNTVISLYSKLLAASRQSFAFSRDSGVLNIPSRWRVSNNMKALPFSSKLYSINSYTKTPVNTVWFDAILAIFLGLLVFAGTQAINAVFALSVTGLYFAHSIPIMVRFTGDNDFKPGPFHLGIFVSLSTNLFKVNTYRNRCLF